MSESLIAAARIQVEQAPDSIQKQRAIQAVEFLQIMVPLVAVAFCVALIQNVIAWCGMVTMRLK